MGNLKKVGIIFSIIVVCLLMLLFSGKGTYTAYESEVKASVSSNIATWNIKLNNVTITDTYKRDVTIDDVIWNSNDRANRNKVAPGSEGQMKLLIDPSNTQVAIRYDITYEDHSINSQQLLTVLNIDNNDHTLIKIGPNTYTGIISLADIKQNLDKNLTIQLKWINNDDNNNRDSAIGLEEEEAKHCSFIFVAKQYKGESITPYQ